MAGIGRLLDNSYSKLYDIQANTHRSQQAAININTNAGYIYSLMQKQWGYGYGGTAVIESNSPAGWLQQLRNYNLYNGSLPGSSITSWGTAGLVAYLSTLLQVTSTLDEYGSSANRSVGALVSYIANKTYQQNLLSIYSGQLPGDSVSARHSLATLSHRNLLALYGNGTLTGSNSTGSFSAGNLLLNIANQINDERQRLQTFIDYFVAHNKLVSKGLSDILAKMDSINVSFDGSVSVDMSGVERRLDDIAKLLLAAGAVENAKDLVSAIVGDFDKLASPALLGEVSAAASQAFPFCIPAVVKQVLGIMEAEPMPPSFDFEIGGEVMHVDTAGMQGFADVIGWACRFLFVFGCLVSTRKFIYTGVVSQ